MFLFSHFIHFIYTESSHLPKPYLKYNRKEYGKTGHHTLCYFILMTLYVRIKDLKHKCFKCLWWKCQQSVNSRSMLMMIKYIRFFVFIFFRFLLSFSINQIFWVYQNGKNFHLKSLSSHNTVYFLPFSLFVYINRLSIDWPFQFYWLFSTNIKYTWIFIFIFSFLFIIFQFKMWAIPFNINSSTNCIMKHIICM